jgi:hypothetical protein
MRRFLRIELLWTALVVSLVVAACSSSSPGTDASGTAGTSAAAGAGGTTGMGGTTGNAGRGGRGGTGTGGMNCLRFDTPGFDRGTPCPRDASTACYAQCDFDGIEYVGCISGSSEITECFASCGSCP